LNLREEEKVKIFEVSGLIVEIIKKRRGKISGQEGDKRLLKGTRNKSGRDKFVWYNLKVINSHKLTRLK